MTTFNRVDKQTALQRSQGELNANIFKKGGLQTDSQSGFNNDNFLNSSQNLQELVDERYFQLKKLYDERINSLYNNIKLIASKFDNDDILNTMKNDAISNEFIHQRLKEIIDETLVKEKEENWRRMNDEIADLRTKLAFKEQQSNELKNRNISMKEEFETKLAQMHQLMNNEHHSLKTHENTSKALQKQIEDLHRNYENDITRMNEEWNAKYLKITTENNKIKTDYNSLIDNLQKCNEKFNAILLEKDDQISSLLKENSDFKLEFERLQKVISVLEIDHNDALNLVNDKTKKLETLQNEYTNMQTQNFALSLKVKSLSDEKESMTNIIEQFTSERKTMLEKFNQSKEEDQKKFEIQYNEMERKYKDLNNQLKKKLLEYKNLKIALESQLEESKSALKTLETTSNKVILKLTEDMNLIKEEWERRVEDNNNAYMLALKESETKYSSDMSNLKNSHQLEIEYKNKEIAILKSQNEMIKSFEKEYVKIEKHEDIVNKLKEECAQKLSSELKQKEEQYEAAFRSRCAMFEEEKKISYEFLIENYKKSIKKLENANEDVMKLLKESQDKLRAEKDSNSSLTESNEVLKKNVKFLQSQIDEEHRLKKNLKDKLNEYEAKLANASSLNISLQENINSLVNKINFLEGEKKALQESLLSKDEFYKKDLENLEMKFADYKDLNNQKFQEECDNHENTKKILEDLESSYKEFQAEYSSLSAKNNELSNQIAVFEELTHNLNNKLKGYETESEKLERKVYESEKKHKKLLIDTKQFSDILLKIFKSKLTTLKSDLNQMKNICLNELNSFKKDYGRRLEESLAPKVKMFLLNLERQNEFKLKVLKDGLTKEYEKKLEEKDEEYINEINTQNLKFEKKLNEVHKSYEKLEKDYNSLAEQHQAQVTINRENNYKIQEYDQENKKLQVVNSNLQSENDSLSSLLEKLNQDKKYISKLKEENEEIEEKKSRQIAQSYQSSLSQILQTMTKIKGKYQQEILLLKNEVEKLSVLYENEMINVKDNYQRFIEGLERVLNEEKEANKRLRGEIEGKENDFINVRREIERLGKIYESKIEVLNNKINLDKEKLIELKNELRSRNDNMGELNTINNELKTQLKSMKSQVDSKNEELLMIKKEYEKLIISKERRIGELQGLINQSYISYNSGVNNIKIANHLDDEIKSMMKKLNLEKTPEASNNMLINNNSTSGAAMNNSSSDYKKKK